METKKLNDKNCFENLNLYLIMETYVSEKLTLTIRRLKIVSKFFFQKFQLRLTLGGFSSREQFMKISVKGYELYCNHLIETNSKHFIEDTDFLLFMHF